MDKVLGTLFFWTVIYTVLVLAVALVISFPLLWLAPSSGIAVLFGLGYWNWFTVCLMAGLLGIAGRLFSSSS